MNTHPLYNILYLFAGVLLGISFATIAPAFRDLLIEKLDELSERLNNFENRNNGGD